MKDCTIHLQERKAKSSHQANNVLNTELFTMVLVVEDLSSDMWYLNSGATTHDIIL